MTRPFKKLTPDQISELHEVILDYCHDKGVPLDGTSSIEKSGLVIITLNLPLEED